jgi:hypothetical protein
MDINRPFMDIKWVKMDINEPFMGRNRPMLGKVRADSNSKCLRLA